MAKTPKSKVSIEAAMLQAKSMARSLDNVKGIDYGVIYVDGKPTKRLGIRFHMIRKRMRAALARDQLLPNKIGGVDIDVLAAGYRLQEGNPRAPHDPLQPGISIGSKKQLTTGTLGPIVYDKTNQNQCLLSNWHVFCGGPEARAGDEIAQPGPMDFTDGPTVALLERWLGLGEQFDAALARLSASAHASQQLFDMTFRPVAIKAPAVGMRLVKSGAVSGVTHAVVDGISGHYRLDYTQFGDGPQWMQGFRLVRDPNAPSDAVSLPGDSGSLWIDSSDGAAVGLHFAGEDDDSPLNDYALAHPIDDVFSRLNVTLSSS